jgi:hypothetical protein
MQIHPAPPPTVHRIMEDLNWSRQERGGRLAPPDGVTNRANTMVKATTKRVGVSFFEPDPLLGDAVHKELTNVAGEGPRCYVTVPAIGLPANLGFVQDMDLKLAIGDGDGDGDGDAVVVCGRHWTLFTTVTQPTADFEAAYRALQPTARLPRAAEPQTQPLDIDDSRMPFDRLTYAVVVALEELVDSSSSSPNTRLFAWLYSKHLRAADVAFADLLHIPAIANMAATALDAWFVRHPVFKAHAHEAQDLLATVLEDYTPTRPRYEPYWVALEKRRQTPAAPARGGLEGGGA